MRNDYEAFRAELFPSEGEWFLQEAKIILFDKILAKYREKVGGISILDTYLYRDVGRMFSEACNKLLPCLESACQYEQRKEIWEQRKLEKPPEGTSERRSHRNPRPSDVVQMIINTHMHTILEEQAERIEKVGEIIREQRKKQEEEMNIAKRYIVEVV